MRKRVIAAVLGFFVAQFWGAAAADVTPREFATAINVAGRQRMLSQKMAKEFLLAQLGVEPAENKGKMQEDMQLFEVGLQRLLNGNEPSGIPAPPSKEIKNQFEQVKLLWSNYKIALVGEGGDAIKRVSTFGDPVLREADKAVKAYESAAEGAGVKAGAVVNLAGRQRMLSQQMTKQILLIATKTDVDENISKLRAAESLFDETHRSLVNGNSERGLPKTKNAAILGQMKKVGQTWGEFKQIVDAVVSNEKADKNTAQQIAPLSARLLGEMDKAVNMYAGSAK